MSTDSDEELAFQIESRLTSHGIYVTDFEKHEDRYEVVYESFAADEGAIPHREIGRVINVFRDLHSDDWSGAYIEGEVLDLDGEKQGDWHVKAEWIDELHNGDLTEVEFSERVIDTLTTAGT
jgi:hypothetical protein